MPSNPPVSLDRIRAKSERIKLWGGIIAMVLGNIVALTTAALAHFKEEKGAKNVYQELSVAVEKVSDDQVRLHQDIARIHGYLAGQAEKSKAFSLKVGDEDGDGIAERPAPIRVGVRPRPRPRAVAPEMPDSVTIVPPVQAPPPKIAPVPDDYDAPPVDSVVEKK